jgi:hypothetical protein
MRKKKFILASQPSEGLHKHALAYAFLLMLFGTLSSTSFLVGYGFADMREDNNQSFLALGVTPMTGTVLCSNSISFLPNMAISGAVLPTNYVELHYQGVLSPPVVCYKNYTCVLKYINGTYYNTISSSDPLSVFLNMTNVSTMMSYKGQCIVYDQLGGNATTEDRYLTIIGPVGVNTVTNTTNIINISNITPGHTNTVDIFEIFAILIILLFIAAQFSNMPILGVFAALLLMLMGIMILTDGIVYKVGASTSGDDMVYASGSTNVSGNTTYTNETVITYKNTTLTNAYAKMTVPYVDFSSTLGLILILISMFGILHYSLQVGESLRGA